jgi:hypothetical protein
VLESIHHQRNEITINDMIIKENLIPDIETYDTPGLSGVCCIKAISLFN